VAAGVYVVSQVFNKQMNRLSSAVYTIGGSWNEPNISFDRIFDDTTQAPIEPAPIESGPTESSSTEPTPVAEFLDEEPAAQSEPEVENAPLSEALPEESQSASP
jgi:hypothetical protein